MDSYSAAATRRIVRVSQRQLDYWDEIGLVCASVKRAKGKGSMRRYSFGDLIKLSVVKRLRQTGLSLQKIRKGLARLGSVEPLKNTMLVTDGHRLYRRVNGSQLEELATGQYVLSVVAIGALQHDLRSRVDKLNSRDFAERGRPRSAAGRKRKKTG